MNGEELVKNNAIVGYKQKIMDALMSSPYLAELCKLEDYDPDCLDDLMWDNYTPTLFVEDDIEKKEVYIMFDFSYEQSRITTYANINLVMQIYCHKDIIRLPNGLATRIDAAIAEINRLIDGQNIIGIGYNDKVYDRILQSTNIHYTARELVFRVVDINEVSKYGKPHRKR